MTRPEIIAALAALDARLANRVEVWRVIINPDGTPTGQRIYRGSFDAPPGWQPPTFEELMKKGAKE